MEGAAVPFIVLAMLLVLVLVAVIFAVTWRVAR